MKKGLVVLSLVVTFFALSAVSVSAVTNDTVKVGLRYGSSVMSSANLENDDGRGYEFGYFEDDRTFVSLGETDETTITMEPMSRGGIQVVITGTDQVLWETEEDTLAVMPQGRDPVTWFRGNRYRGGFEYTVSGGGLQVVNVVDLEDYVKGVLPLPEHQAPVCLWLRRVQLHGLPGVQRRWKRHLRHGPGGGGDRGRVPLL